MKSSLLILCGFIFALACGEAVVRFSGVAPTVHPLRIESLAGAYEQSSNPKLGYVLKKNFRKEVGQVDENLIEYTNNLGFRDLDRKKKPETNVERWVLLGDSVVVGHGIKKKENLIGPQMQNIVGDKYEVISMGVGGYNTESEVELFEQYGQDLGAKKLLLIFVSNDYKKFNTQVTKYRRSRPELINWLFLNYSTFRLAALQLDLFSFATDSSDESLMKWNKDSLSKDNVRAGLSRLKELKAKRNFDLTIFLWPIFGDNGIGDNHLGRFDKLKVEELAKEFKIRTIRLSPHFQRHFITIGGSARELYTTGDGMHPNELGAELAAKFISYEMGVFKQQ